MHHKCKITLLLLWRMLCLTKSTDLNRAPPKTVLIIKQNPQDCKDPIADVSTFKELIEKSKTFVDNSLLIPEILQDPSHHLFQWIGPSGLGKSVNLHMLKTFFEIKVDKYGNKTSPRLTNNYKIFAKGEIVSENGHVQKLKSPLLISKCTNIMDEYHAQFPVIFVDFKYVIGENSTIAERKMRLAISEGFKQHDYMSNVLHEKCEKNQQSGKWCQKLKNFQNYLNAKEGMDIEGSLVFLSELLENFFDRKPIILLDDFHMPVFHYLQNDGTFSDDWKQIFDLMEKLIFTTFEKLDLITLGIITGSFKLQYSEFSKKCYLAQKSERIHEYFGISQAHLYTLTDRYKIADDLKKPIFRWYNGYESVISKQSFYTPIAIVRFLKRKEFITYSKEFTNQDYIQRIITAKPALRQAVLELIGKWEPWVQDDKGYYRFEGRFENLRNLLRHRTDSVSDHELKTFYWYLLGEGYLGRMSDSGKAKLLNLEIANILSIRMVYYYKQTYNINERLLQNASISLCNFTRTKPKLNISAVPLEKSLSLLYENTFNDSSLVMDKYSVLSVFYCATLRMHAITKFDIDVYYNKTFIPFVVRCDVDIVIIDNSTKQGVIIAIDYDNLSAKNACHYAWYQREILLTHKYIHHLKFIGISISSNKTVQVLQNKMEWWSTAEESDECVLE